MYDKNTVKINKYVDSTRRIDSDVIFYDSVIEKILFKKIAFWSNIQNQTQKVNKN